MTYDELLALANKVAKDDTQSIESWATLTKYCFESDLKKIRKNLAAHLEEHPNQGGVLLLLGYMNGSGQGGAKDEIKAAALYDRAIVSGNVYAMRNRALQHFTGNPAPKNYQEGAKLYFLCYKTNNNRKNKSTFLETACINELIKIADQNVNESHDAFNYLIQIYTEKNKLKNDITKTNEIIFPNMKAMTTWACNSAAKFLFTKNSSNKKSFQQLLKLIIENIDDHTLIDELTLKSLKFASLYSEDHDVESLKFYSEKVIERLNYRCPPSGYFELGKTQLSVIPSLVEPNEKIKAANTAANLLYKSYCGGLLDAYIFLVQALQEHLKSNLSVDSKNFFDVTLKDLISEDGALTTDTAQLEQILTSEAPGHSEQLQLQHISALETYLSLEVDLRKSRKVSIGPTLFNGAQPQKNIEADVHIAKLVIDLLKQKQSLAPILKMDFINEKLQLTECKILCKLLKAEIAREVKLYSPTVQANNAPILR